MTRRIRKRQVSPNSVKECLRGVDQETIRQIALLAFVTDWAVRERATGNGQREMGSVDDMQNFRSSEARNFSTLKEYNCLATNDPKSTARMPYVHACLRACVYACCLEWYILLSMDHQPNPVFC